MIGRKILKKIRENDGQSLVELAVILPILLFIVYGVLTLGLMVYANMLVVLAASQASEVAADIMNDSTMTASEKYSKVQNVAYTYLDNGINGTDRNVIVNRNGNDVEVTVEYNFKYIFPFVYEIFNGKNEVLLSYKAVNYIE